MTICHLFFVCYYKVNNNDKEVLNVLVGLNSKDIKILDIIQKGNGLIEVIIENRKKKVDALYVINSLIWCMVNKKLLEVSI